MFKNKNKWAGVVLALVMVLAFSTPIFAEGEVDPVESPEVVEETSSFFDHPFVKWIAKFLFDPTVVIEEDPEPEMGGVDLPGEEPSPAEGPLGGGDLMEGTPEPTPELIPAVVPEEAVAALHADENLGFGEIVKLLEIAENAQAKCEENNEENCEVTLGSVIVEYEDGTGMDELYEKYGRPETLGVGQIQKELDPKDNEVTNSGMTKEKDKDNEVTNSGTTKEKDKDNEVTNSGMTKEKDKEKNKEK